MHSAFIMMIADAVLWKVKKIFYSTTVCDQILSIAGSSTKIFSTIMIYSGGFKNYLIIWDISSSSMSAYLLTKSSNTVRYLNENVYLQLGYTTPVIAALAFNPDYISYETSYMTLDTSIFSFTQDDSKYSPSTSTGSFTTSKTGTFSSKTITPSTLTLASSSSTFANALAIWSSYTISMSQKETKSEIIPVTCSTSKYTLSDITLGSYNGMSKQGWMSFDTSTNTLSMTAPESTFDHTYYFSINRQVTSPFTKVYTENITVYVKGSDVCLGIGIENTGGWVVVLILIFGSSLAGSILVMAGVAYIFKWWDHKKKLNEMTREVMNVEPVADEHEPVQRMV